MPLSLDTVRQAQRGATAFRTQECFVVDDKPKNIAADRGIRIHGHVFTSTQACRAALAEVGILASRDR